MSLQWFSLDVDATDPGTLARWWAQVLDCQVVWEEDAYVAIAKDDRTHPGIIFNRVDQPKAGKNRLHWDLTPPTRRPRSTDCSPSERPRSTSARETFPGW